MKYFLTNEKYLSKILALLLLIGLGYELLTLAKVFRERQGRFWVVSRIFRTFIKG